MSVDLKNLPKPQCFSHIPDEYYDRFAEDQFKQLERFAESGSLSSEWGTAVITAMASDTQPKTIALPVETIEVLIELADMANYILPYRDPEKARMAVASAAYAHMRATGVWLDLKSVNPPPSVEISDRVKI
jgi:hypothetical protein